MPERVIEFNRAKLKALKRDYQAALKNNQIVFTFEGTQLLTDYAKYMIDHLTYTLYRRRPPTIDS